jgi:hypothetical protein
MGKRSLHLFEIKVATVFRGRIQVCDIEIRGVAQSEPEAGPLEH